MIAFWHFVGLHTADNIAAMYSILVIEFKVSNNIVVMVTNNAVNIKIFFQNELVNKDEATTKETEKVEVNWEKVQEELTIKISKRYS